MTSIPRRAYGRSRFGALCLAAMALAVVACPIRIVPARTAKPAIPSTPISPAVPMQLEGTYVHAGTGIAFPDAAAKFRRVAPQRYDREGNDVGIGYSRMWGPIRAEVTVYSYPRVIGRDGAIVAFDEQFAMEVAEVGREKKEFRDVRRTDAPGSIGGRAVAGRAAEFEFRSGMEFGMRRVATILTVFPLEPWCVKYRVTVPLDHRDEALAAVEALLVELKLPPLGVPVAPPAPGGR
jgi:hypothetical protein